MRSFILLLVLAIYWWLLSGQTGVFLIGSGVVCILWTLYMCKRLGIVDEESIPIRAFFGALGYAPWLLWQVLLSNIHVAKIVWAPEPKINPKTIKVPLKTKTAFGTATFANSITLTPGTVTVEVNDDEVVVHALTDETAADLLSGSMQDKICKMEGQDPA